MRGREIMNETEKKKKKKKKKKKMHSTIRLFFARELLLQQIFSDGVWISRDRKSLGMLLHLVFLISDSSWGLL